MATPMKITKADASRAMDRLASVKNRIAKVQREAEERVEQVVRTFEVAGTAFGIGVMQGRTGGIEVVGIPLELGGGLLLEVLGHLDFAGKMSGHLINVGDGALAAYATTLGRGVGQEWSDKAAHHGGSKQVKTGSSGTLPSGGLSPEEIAMAAAAGARVA